ncbi:hypothetical protein GLOTRDRAFT_129419 [Gloeophyllum trabeum ATCC 11539]|uniref:Uncharacterized protein n=1 Tax=Gloeophyllum trabeum (strain ATCC 11539 / FP-39264 / Madison 617) TaxID=670483 RepID=S7Q524_GLOTA|nr:uncharacterized protein GLOTRDRAFT_129419 [Gloeophyllum trabeum ATCC 11539]EPQ55126.1 hypothetical protein GLOTRDRAFT_129419 [Gloeophyllum trabeum ATCC 11539]
MAAKLHCESRMTPEEKRNLRRLLIALAFVTADDEPHDSDEEWEEWDEVLDELWDDSDLDFDDSESDEDEMTESDHKFTNQDAFVEARSGQSTIPGNENEALLTANDNVEDSGERKEELDESRRVRNYPPLAAFHEAADSRELPSGESDEPPATRTFTDRVFSPPTNTVVGRVFQRPYITDANASN